MSVYNIHTKLEFLSEIFSNWYKFIKKDKTTI